MWSDWLCSMQEMKATCIRQNLNLSGLAVRMAAVSTQDLWLGLWSASWLSWQWPLHWDSCSDGIGAGFSSRAKAMQTWVFHSWSALNVFKFPLLSVITEKDWGSYRSNVRLSRTPKLTQHSRWCLFLTLNMSWLTQCSTGLRWFKAPQFMTRLQTQICQWNLTLAMPEWWFKQKIRKTLMRGPM